MFWYLGPDSLIPLASFLAAAVGFVLLFWQRIVGLVRRLLGHGQRKEQVDLPSPEEGVRSTYPEDEKKG